MSEALAECAGVTRVFGHFTAVGGVDLAVGPGEVVGLLGANGAGKTTLIRLLLGLLPVSGGSVRLFGRPPSRASRSRVGYLPQGLGLYEDLTVAQNLAFSQAVFSAARSPAARGAAARGPAARGPAARDPAARGPAARGPAARGPAAGRGAAVPDSLRRYAGVCVADLPLGVARRAAFAQALAHAPDLLLLDEPTSGVDPLARARLWETIGDSASAGAGVIVTTHHMDEAQECSRLVVMASGRVVASGTVPQIVGQDRTAVVRAADWTAALRRLEAGRLRPVLSGAVLRVPGASAAEVARALGDLAASVSEEPATLEERFFELAVAGAAAR